MTRTKLNELIEDGELQARRAGEHLAEVAENHKAILRDLAELHRMKKANEFDED